MTFIEDLSDGIRRLATFDELRVEAATLPATALRLSDASVRELMREASDLIRQATLLHTVLAGVISSRSGRDRGHGGFTQETGHRNAVELIRDVSGISRGEAVRAVKVGESLIHGAGGADADPGVSGVTGVAVEGGAAGEGGAECEPAATPWYQPLRDAVLAGGLTTAQHQAIRGGLGDPPTTVARIGALHDVDASRVAGSGNAVGGGATTDQDNAADGAVDDATGFAQVVTEAWRAAAARLVAEAALCTVEDLAARARVVRDMLDPAGAEERFTTRFARRSYRAWRDADGQRHARITYDDEFGAWLDQVFSTALSPRRGGPRFVAEGEKVAAEVLSSDERSNDQLAYDLLVDLVRAGALANAADVYGTKEAGVRLVAVKDDVIGDTVHRDVVGRLLTTAQSDDGQCTVPGSVLERALCVVGGMDIVTDPYGNPLDVGREQRLYTAKQRIALAVRDGGCLWPGCDRPPAYCEAHHCDHWADGGRTDCARGVLLCRYHHLHLHHGGWRITRDGDSPFLLHPPGGAPPIPLRSKSPLRWLWDPPPDRASWRTAA